MLDPITGYDHSRHTFFTDTGVWTVAKLEEKYPEKFLEAERTGKMVIIEKWERNNLDQYPRRIEYHSLFARPRIFPLTGDRVYHTWEY